MSALDAFHPKDVAYEQAISTHEGARAMRSTPDSTGEPLTIERGFDLVRRPDREQRANTHELVFRHDFSEIRPNSKVRHTFRVKNEGAFPWTVGRVEKTCACAVVNCPPRIEPNTTAEVELEYRAGGARIDESRTVRVHFRESGAPALRLVLRAAVRPPLELSRRELIFHGTGSDYTEQQFFEATNHSGATWESVTAKSEARWLTATARLSRYETHFGTKRQVWRVAVTAKANGLTDAVQTTTLDLECHGAATERARLPVSLRISRGLQPVPARMFFGTFSQDGVAICKVRLICNAAPADKVLDELVVEHDFGAALTIAVARRGDRVVELSGKLSSPTACAARGALRLKLPGDLDTSVELPIVVVLP